MALVSLRVCRPLPPMHEENATFVQNPSKFPIIDFEMRVSKKIQGKKLNILLFQNVQEEIEVANSCTDVSITVTDTISADVITTSIAQSTNNSSPVSTTATQPVSNRTISSRKRRAAEEKNNLLKRTSEPADDALVVFGNHVANELRKYDSQTLPYVKKAILDILFQADTGQFPRRGYYTADYYSSPSSNSTVTINVPTPLPSHYVPLSHLKRYN
ncbi:hypothetical protein EVAR_57704_1 [Eumeta japonica]|uniref:BESS domain-containing protein n=1 Tax=Eumeta variegata TaxID=151549 RepID=A0A4C1Y767_EUMVA|nr:hypothetical protein EVAR_57704_1 [Eumeta japonica]